MANTLFLAAYPDPEDAARIAQIAGEFNHVHRLGGNLRKPELLHVTLVDLTRLKDSPQTIVEKVSSAAMRIAMPAFDVAFDRVGSFSGSRNSKPLVLQGTEGAAGLIALNRALVGALQKEWVKVAANPGYQPHMTLLYSAASIGEQPVAPVSWRAHGFALVNSHAGKSRHEIVARFPLPAGLSAA